MIVRIGPIDAVDSYAERLPAAFAAAGRELRETLPTPTEIVGSDASESSRTAPTSNGNGE